MSYYPYVIGIDGGGTKTVGLLLDQDGHVLATDKAGASNPNDVGLEASCTLISHMAERLVQKAGVAGQDCCLFGGIAGALNHRENMLMQMSRQCNMGCMDIGSDVINLLSSALPEGDGACIICGTGSACFLRKGRELVRIGGWGYLLDSAGSGYDIGRQGLEAVLRAHDLRGEPTMLTGLVCRALDAPAEKSITAIYDGGKPLIASLAPLVFEAADAGDAVAEAILQRNALAILEYIQAAQRHLGCHTALPVVLGGGIFQHVPAFVERLKSLLPDSNMPVTLQVAQLPPVWGAVVEAYRRSGGTPDYAALRSAFLSANLQL